MTTVYDGFLAEPYHFDFFAAVRLLHAAQPDAGLIGTDAQPENEVVRFRNHLSLAFPPSQIVEFNKQIEIGPPQMTIAFLGLYGPKAVLPLQYTQMLLDTHRDVRGPERRALRDWLDLFNHRFISLFYQAWAKYRGYATFQQRAATQTEDQFTLAVRSLMGLGTAGLQQRHAVAPRTLPGAESYDWGERSQQHGTKGPLASIPDLALVYFAGLFAQQSRPQCNLVAILSDYFAIPVTVEPFDGQWLRTQPEDQLCLSGQQGLGHSGLLGDRVWDVQGGVLIRLGPLSLDEFTEFLPDLEPVPQRKQLHLLAQLTRTYIGQEFDIRVQCVLKAADVPPLQLGGVSEPGPRIGWNTWLTSHAPAEPVGDAIFPGEWVTTI